MVPPLDDNGYLPPGIHSATLDEIEMRFGLASEIRQAEMESLHWLLDLASAPSRLNFRVEPLQFDPCFVNRELPIDGSLLLVDAA